VQHWQLPFLGLREFPADLTPFEIQYFFTFTPQERTAILSRYGDHHRLAAALHIGFLKMTGRTLAAFDAVPLPVLQHVREHLGLQTPPSEELTSLSVLYSRGQTLLDHQTWAAQLVGFHPFTDRRQRVLVMHLRREAHNAVTLNRLVEFSRRWLYEQRILLPADRRLRDLARTAYADAEHAMADMIHQHIPQHVLDAWSAALFVPHHGNTSTLEWLQQAPRRKLKGLREQLEKVRFLRSLQVDRYPLDAIRLERQRDYARQMRRRRPARFRALAEPRRTLAMVCCLHMTLLQSTDVALAMAERLIQALHARATRDVRDAERRGARTFRQALHAMQRVLSDPTIPDGALRQEILACMPAVHALFPSRAAAIRGQLSEHARQVRPLLKTLVGLAFEGEGDTPLLLALSRLRALYASRSRQLPDDIDVSFAAQWAELIDGIDRQRALRAFEAMTLLALRKALRHGAVWVAHSLAYRRRKALLISEADWETQRRRWSTRLGIPMQAASYTPQLLTNLEAGLVSLAEAVEAGEVRVDDQGVHLKALEAEEVPPDLESTKQALCKEVGVVQLPALLMAIDAETRFSWRLLGRVPTTAQELRTAYAALLAQGTELDAASVALMLPALSAEAIAEAMRLFEDDTVLRDANALVLEFLHRHAVVRAWGEGTFASADAMSLEASRHLWNARVDPRRRAYAIGIYSHVLDQWGIIYDQPLVLHQRQAGAAIEGVVRQTTAANVERLAVDTHGYTDVGMAISKLLGFDLCPRWSHLRDRRLHIPREVAVPAVLEGVVERDVSLRQLETGWDQLIRVTASIDGGWLSAVLAMERFGAAARADPIHQAGSALGKLLRSLFLCDYLSNPAFRREILRILNHGESVHTLQRVIHFGSIAAARGRRQEELVAISGALTLLANIVMAWMTHSIQRVLDAWHHAGTRRVETDVLRHIAPVHFAGINFRGVMPFPMAQYRSRLILAASSSTPRMANAAAGDAPTSQEPIDSIEESDQSSC
jgi:TnpA family transposase